MPDAESVRRQREFAVSRLSNTIDVGGQRRTILRMKKGKKSGTPVVPEVFQAIAGQALVFGVDIYEGFGGQIENIYAV